MRRLFAVVLVAAGASGAVALAQDALRFDRPLFTVEGAVLCPRQTQVAAIQRALDANNRAAADRIITEFCKAVGADIPLTVVSRPGRYDRDVEVRAVATPDPDPAVPRGARWTLKTMVRN
ncbi:hypothetical protein [Siccirubricoccus phaeus]|uniref:hypothetical protein n=1 Tax=Siccirubricoccus phaeus TaxID=2595053 RepID=UPI0011F26EFD|nr:hypothetical protein [Siccirubricoccus phaeus]